MLKVLVVMPCYYPAMHYGGPVTAVHQMNKALVREGIDVTVFTTNANGPSSLEVPLCEQVIVEGIKVYYFPIPFGGRYFYSPKLAQALRESLDSFDLVHINWLYVYTTMMASRLCVKMNVPYLLTPHGMLDSYSTSLKSFWKKKLYISLIEKAHILNAAVIHYSSLGEKEEAVINNWKVNTSVVPNGVEIQGTGTNEQEVDICNPEYSALSNKKIVLFLGRLNYIKGLDLLLRAWPQVINSVEDAHLVIAGPDSDGYMSQLKKLALFEGVTDSVTFTGMVLGKEKEALFNISDVFVSSSYLESFGMAIVEAMSYGLPVVITDRVNIKSEIEEARAGLVSSCNAKSIATNIIYLLLNENTAKQMGKKGEQLAQEKYEISMASKEMAAVYQSIAG